MLDHTDLAIIDELRANGRMTMKELGAKVHLSAQAARLRVDKLEEMGVITGYTAIVEPAKLGLPVHAFLHLFMNNIYHGPLHAFLNAQQYVVRTHKISGDACYLLEARFPSNVELDDFLTELNAYANYRLSIVIR